MKLSPHAKPAYDAYCHARNWHSVSCQPLPSLDQQSPDLQLARSQAAEAAITSHLAELESSFNPNADEHIINMERKNA